MDMTKVVFLVTIVVTLKSIEVTAQLAEAMQCVQKLMPCEPYIHSDIPPSPSCCTPMKEVAEKDVTCLCAVFKHPNLLALINLTKENALNLLKSCGANHDESICKSDAVSSSTASPGSSSGSSSVSTTKDEALAISLLGFILISALIGY